MSFSRSEKAEANLMRADVKMYLETNLLTLFDVTTFLSLMADEIQAWEGSNEQEKRLADRIDAQVESFADALRAVCLVSPAIYEDLEVYALGFSERQAVRRLLAEISRTSPGQGGGEGQSGPPPAPPGGETRTG